MQYNTYKLISGKKTGSWKLPLNDVLIEKDGNLKKVCYVPGADTYFREDIKGDVKEETIWFDEGKKLVPKNNRVLNSLLQDHPWFNKHFEIDDIEISAQRELDELEKKTKTANLIDDSDEDKLRAMALAVFGGIAMNWPVSKCKSSLLKMAYNTPDKLVKILDSTDYEQKFASGVAFNKGIVKYNKFKTAIVWATGDEGTILPLAKGENGITKLAEFFSEGTEESNQTLQEIGNRISKTLGIDTEEKDSSPKKKAGRPKK